MFESAGIGIALVGMNRRPIEANAGIIFVVGNFCSFPSSAMFTQAREKSCGSFVFPALKIIRPCRIEQENAEQNEQNRL
jgi:hypothetical protein